MRFQILGPLEIHVADTTIPPAGQRVQRLLAVLLLNANRVVPVSYLVDAVWDDDPPATAKRQIQNVLSALRRRLAEAGRGAGLIVADGPGYLIHVEDGQLDAQLFAVLVATAQDLIAQDPPKAVDVLHAALRLWRGPALAGITGRAILAGAVRLDEQRLAAFEQLFDLELGLGRHHDVVAELTALATQHPTRERIVGQLMLALYRSHRQADALQEFQHLRIRLADELGVDPGPPLQQLYTAILRNDITDTSARPSAVTLAVAPPPPGQLPRDPSDFTGRADEVAALCQLLTTGSGAAVPVVCVTGRPGVGKSALAVHIGHLLRTAFPDGQLYAELHGTAGPRVDPGTVLTAFLHALGVPGPAVPTDAAERVALYRSLLAGRRVLVVLDDAGEEAQVRPLLPGQPPSAAVITSRNWLAGLEGTQIVDLGLLPADDALDLLGRVAGARRLAADGMAAARIVSYCGRLPLAVRIAGARLAATPAASAADFAVRLSDECRRLAELSIGDLDVRSSLGLSYHTLPAPARRAFRMLGLTTAADVAGWLLAALLDAPQPVADDLLTTLGTAHLLDVSGRDGAGQVRYRPHDLLRLYARERLAEEEPPAAQVAAVRRATDAATERVERATADLQTDRHARTWLASERPTLVSLVELALTHQHSSAAAGLAAAVAEFLETGTYLDDWQHTQRLALTAARHAGDCRLEASAQSRLAAALWMSDRWTEARQHVEAAIPTLHRLGERLEEARALRTLGRLCHEQGQWSEALARLAQSQAILETLGHHRELARTLCDIGMRHRFGDRPATAIAHLGRGIELYEAAGDRYDAAVARLHLACAHRDAGDLRRAVTGLHRALDEIADFGDRVGQAQVLFQLAVTYVRMGDRPRARPYFESSLALARQLGQQLGTGMILLNLADLHADDDRPDEARQCLDNSMHIFDELDSAYWRGRALASLGRLHTLAGAIEPAKQAWQAAVELLAPLGAPEAEEIRARLIVQPAGGASGIQVSRR